ncbi:MAG: aldehyde dehydrogenase family protein [Myxococcota bacterium]
MAIVESVESALGTRRRLRLSSPIDGQPIGDIEVQGKDDVRAALEAARKAQPAWAALSFRARAAYLERALSILIERHEEFIDVVVRETGKTRLEALYMEIVASCDALQYYARRSEGWLRPRRVRMHLLGLTKRLHMVFRPLGVVGIITPWNGPFILSLNPTVQALMAGNAVLLKPSEVTPHSGRLVGELFRAAGLPEGVLQVLLGDGETGAALVEAGVDKISFTGSVSTGRKIGEACGRQLVPCTLELGGKDAMIVCADANLERAAGGALFGAFMNTGQVCVAVERVYVVGEVAEAFIETVVAKTRALRQGQGDDVDVGAIFWPHQLDIIEAHVEDARARGATIHAGGRRNPHLGGLYYEPTVISGVTHEMRVMREETFGPVLAIMRVRDEEEALQLANDSCYGLSGSVWTRDRKRGLELAQRLETGSVSVNETSLTYGVTEAPFGGVKQSGVGQVNGETGLRGFCHARPIIVDRFGLDREQAWYPFSAAKARTMRRIMRLVWGTPLRRWIS